MPKRWRGKVPIARGHTLVDCIAGCDPVAVSDGVTRHSERLIPKLRVQKSFIDVTMIQDKILAYAKNWKVTKNEMNKTTIGAKLYL